MSTTEALDLGHLTLARRRIVERPKDPGAPAYTIAPLSNQLRLIQKRIDEVFAVDENDGMPTEPAKVTFVDLLGYQRDLRQARLPSGRGRRNQDAQGRDEVFTEWSAVGFELRERSGHRDDVDRWVAQCRAVPARW